MPAIRGCRDPRVVRANHCRPDAGPRLASYTARPLPSCRSCRPGPPGTLRRSSFMRVQLIHPPAFLNPTALTALRPSLPLGIAYIAAALRAAGHDVSVLDAVGAAPDRVVRKGRVAQLGLEVDETVARLDPQARMIGVTSMFTY